MGIFDEICNGLLDDTGEIVDDLTLGAFSSVKKFGSKTFGAIKKKVNNNTPGLSECQEERGTNNKPTKIENKRETENETIRVEHEEIYTERIEKLIRLVISDGELDDDSIKMLERAAEREGLDPDEVVFVTKKRLKKSRRMGVSSSNETLMPPPIPGNNVVQASSESQISSVKLLVAALSENDKKYNNAIEAIMMGDSSSSSIWDAVSAVTGGVTGMAISLGQELFGDDCDDDDDKIMRLEEMRENQRVRIISRTIIPDSNSHLMELLEYVFTQVKMKTGDYEEERKAWKVLHETAYNRAKLMFEGDMSKMDFIEKFNPEVLKKTKKRFGFF